MANIKFSQLPTTTSLTGATLPVVQGGNNYQVTAATIQSYVLGSGSGLSVSGNIVGGNVSVTGNIRGNVFFGNGSGLTNINAGNIVGAYGNANVAAYLPTYTGNITAGNVSATGNIQGSYLLGNGSQLTGIPPQYTNANVASYLPTYTGNLAGGNVSVTGNIQGNVFFGNGSGLTNINASNIIGNYGNANVAAYLPTYTGNITANTVSATGTVYLGQQYVEKTSSQTFSNPYTPNIANGTIQQITATSTFTLNLPVGMTAGQNITLIITQDATGSRFLSPNAAYKFAYGIKALSTSANAIDMLSIFYDGTNYLCCLVNGYQ